MKLNSFY